MASLFHIINLKRVNKYILRHCDHMSFQRPPGIGLPDTPVMMHDLNLDEMMAPRYATPVQPTGKLKVQLQFGEKALHVIIIEVTRNLLKIAYMRGSRGGGMGSGPPSP